MRSPARLLGLGASLLISACALGEEFRLGGAPPAHTGGTRSGGAPADGGRLSTGGLAGESVGGGASSGGWAGDGSPSVVVRVNAIEPLSYLNSEDKDDNPTLSRDELTLCFTSNRPTSTGGTDVWCSERASRDAPFGQPLEQADINTEGFESSPALAPDGLTLWFSSDVDGDLNIYTATRRSGELRFELAVAVTELNSIEDDIPRPPAMNSQVMPMASRRDSPDYWTYLATRPSALEPFGEPQLITELAAPGRSFVDAFLSESGLYLFFSLNQEDGNGDLFVAARPSLNDPFGAPQPIDGLNTSADERDPFPNADGTRFYFTSDRDGKYDLFVADVEFLYGL